MIANQQKGKKMIRKIAAVMLLVAVVTACAKDKNVAPVMESTMEKASYTIGYDIGMNISRDIPDLDFELLQKGLKDAANGVESLLNEEEAQQAMMQLRMEMATQMQAEMAAVGVKNEAEGKAYLEANAVKDGVMITSSGLQYEILEAGTGEKPGLTDTVTVHYTGKLIDGTVFDSSVERGQPATFPLQGVIPGWTEALQLMKEGAKWRIHLPADLAYGERGSPPIGPNAVLIFDVELISID